MADITPTPGFFDGLGDRVLVVDRTAGSLEVLRLRPELTADPAFEPTLRARAEQLAALQHAAIARVRHVGRLPAPDNRLAIVSDAAPGLRLSEVLQASEQLNLPLHTNAALFLLRQLVGVMAFLHDAGPDVSHGAAGPERLVVSPTGRLTLVEHVLGSALPHVPRALLERPWKELRVAPAAGEQPPFGRRTDLLQVGLCGLALVLSRPLRIDEYPMRLHDLFEHATESRVTGERRPLRAPLREWIARATGVAEERSDRWTIDEARSALDSLLSSEGYLAAPTGLVTLMQAVQRYYTGGDPASAPAAAPAQASAPNAASAPTPAPAPVPATIPEPTSAPAVEARPAPALRLVSFPSAAPASAAPVEARALESAQVKEARPTGLSPARTRGALAMAAPLAREESVPADESFAPEPGVSFPPDDPEPQPAVLPPAAPPPHASGAHAVAAASPSGPAAATATPPRPPDPHPSGATPIQEPPGAFDSLVEPIAASLDRDRLADLVHTRHGRSESSGSHRLGSGTTRSASLMFGSVGGEEGRKGGGFGMPLKLAGGVGVLVALLVIGWFIFGGNPDKDPAPTLSASVSGTESRAPARAPRAAQDEGAVRPAARPAATTADPAPSPVIAEAELPASLAGAAAEAEKAGSLRLAMPFVADVFEDGVKLGTSETPIVLGAGRHVLDLVNRDLALTLRQAVTVQPGRATLLTPKLPDGTANINATPWAEVWIDGARAGETPLGNLALPVGTHQVVFRHPELGEQARTLVVTAGAPARLSVEMKQ